MLLFYGENKKPSGFYIRKIKETFSVLLVLKYKVQYVVLKWENLPLAQMRSWVMD